MKTDRSPVALLTSKLLSPYQVAAVFCAALSVHALPLWLNNYLYWDDIYRSSFTVMDPWKEEGRFFGEYLVRILTMSAAAPNVYPLTLFVAMLVMAYALTKLAQYLFGHPSLAQCAIVLPLWYNPYFLQVLSYHYDAFTISLGVALMILAITYRHRIALVNWAAPSLLVAMGISTYQGNLNMFLGLACVDVLHQAHWRPLGGYAWRRALHHAKVLAGGGLLYYLTSYQYITEDRGGLIWPTAQQWSARGALIADKVMLFVNPANAIMFAVLAASAVIGWVCVVIAPKVTQQSTCQRLARLALCMAALLGMFLSVGGILFFLRDMNYSLHARVLLGLSPLLVGLLYLAYIGWARLGKWAMLLVFPPLFCFLSFAYAYGQVMSDKKELDNFAATLLATDILNNARIQAVREIVVFNSDTPFYTPVCVNVALPAMDYIFNNRFPLLPERMRKWGLSQFKKKVEYNPKPSYGDPVLVRPFYKVYIENEVAYIQFTAQPTHLECN